MQIKIFTIPIAGGDLLMEEMNAFLRSSKIMQIEQVMVQEPGGAAWSFCIRYLEDHARAYKNRERVDYKSVLDEASFQRFSRLRVLRKNAAAAEGVPPFIVFTDEELSELAKMESLSEQNMKSVKGIGTQKVEKYAAYFLEKNSDAESQPPY